MDEAIVLMNAGVLLGEMSEPKDKHIEGEKE